MLKKKKRTKITHSPPAEGSISMKKSSTVATAVAAMASAAEKVLESPATAAVANA